MPPKATAAKPAGTKKSIIVPSKVYTKDSSSTTKPQDLEGIEEAEITAQISVPAEGGWGWVVVAASFLTIFVLDGVYFTFGSIFHDMCDDLKVGESLVALVNSVAVAVYFMGGPLVSALINRFGFRAVCMAVAYLPSLAAIKASPSKTKREGVMPSAAERLFSAVSNAHFPTAAAVVGESTVPTPTQAGPSTAVASRLTLTAQGPQGGISRRQLKQVQSLISKSKSRVSVKDKEETGEITLEINANIEQPVKRSLMGRLFHWEEHVAQARPMYRDDAFYEGRLDKLPAYKQSMMETTPEARTGLEYQMAVSRAATAAKPAGTKKSIIVPSKVYTKDSSSTTKPQDLEGIEEAEITAQISVPAEGGWDGVYFTFGSIFHDMCDDLKVGESLVALVNSVAVAVYFMGGPLVSALINRFGFRAVCMAVAYLPSLAAIKASPSKTKREGVMPSAAERLFSAVSNAHFPTAAAVVGESTVPTPTQAGPSTAVASRLTLTAQGPQGGISRRQLKQVQSLISKSKSRVSVKDKEETGEITLEINANIEQPVKRSLMGRLFHWEEHVAQARPMYRDDAFYEGRLDKLPAYKQSMMETTPEARTGLEYQMAVSRAQHFEFMFERILFCDRPPYSNKKIEMKR
uniref:Uncharacterized protein n=1 Tax=Heliothis virescens TaxID=7102 RepID=A0A2A4K316_HELVI